MSLDVPQGFSKSSGGQGGPRWVSEQGEEQVQGVLLEGSPPSLAPRLPLLIPLPLGVLAAALGEASGC